MRHSLPSKGEIVVLVSTVSRLVPVVVGGWGRRGWGRRGHGDGVGTQGMVGRGADRSGADRSGGYWRADRSGGYWRTDRSVGGRAGGPRAGANGPRPIHEKKYRENPYS